MFLNTEVIHSEPQRHFSGTRPRQTPHPPLSIPLSTGGEPAQGRHQLSSSQGLHYMQPLTATTFSKPKARSKVNDKCCSVKANLLCKTCLSLSGILNYFFFVYSSHCKKTTMSDCWSGRGWFTVHCLLCVFIHPRLAVHSAVMQHCAMSVYYRVRCLEGHLLTAFINTNRIVYQKFLSSRKGTIPESTYSLR